GRAQRLALCEDDRLGGELRVLGLADELELDLRLVCELLVETAELALGVGPDRRAELVVPGLDLKLHLPPPVRSGTPLPRLPNPRRDGACQVNPRTVRLGAGWPCRKPTSPSSRPSRRSVARGRPSKRPSARSCRG